MKTTVTTSPSSAALPAATAAPPVHPLAAVATPGAPDRSPEQNAAGARRFAELLRARRSEAVAPPRPAAVPQGAAATADIAPNADTGERCDAPETAGAPPASTSSRALAEAKGSTPGAKQATTKPTVDTAAAHTEGKGDVGHDEQGPPAASPPGDRPPGLALLAALPAPRDAATTDEANGVDLHAHDDGAVATNPVETSGREGAASTTTFGVRGKAAVDNAEERVVAAVSDHVPGKHADAPFTSALADVVRAAEPSLSHATRASDSAAVPIVASGTAAAGPIEPRDAAAPATALALATPIDSPDFAAALGVQVSVLARDGVQHAELHLHPVETGPVSIRIEVDGTTARIDFGADLAATRQAIEQGLPELASALRDAGLTLAGGGVSQHAGSQPRGDDGAEPARTPASAVDAAAAAAPARSALRRIAAGGVDVYA